jgi:hypothetical protein
MQAFLVDGPQLKPHIAQLVSLKLDILPNPGYRASLSQIPLQDCQQKNNYTAQNCRLSYTI